MKPVIFRLAYLSIIFATLGFIGCTSMGFGYSEDELKKAVEFETECPRDDVKIVKAMDGGTGHTKFVVDACGTEQRWDRMGTSYVPAERSLVP